MDIETQIDHQALPDEVSEKASDICRQFVQACESGQQPDVKGYINRVEAPYRSVLLTELLRLELAHRYSDTDETPSVDDYFDQYPDYSGVISRVFNEFRAGSGKPGSTGRADDEPTRAMDSSPTAVPVMKDRFPGYRIIKELHRGGQGIVYQAVQLSTKRKVALKVLIEGPFASPESRRRFEREVALVGSLRHPNIVPVFDSGVVDGHCFFAMEYIRGVSLSRFVQRERLTVRKTLELFRQICDAVDFAHQRGVIHRDLKPSNVVVDDDGKPHVLDFGLAKAGGSESELISNAIPVSVTGQLIGTLPYMSPEHAAGRPSDVDMRSDVYSLGVILYELLTGKFPYQVAGEMAHVLQNIAQAEPLRPSSIGRRVDGEVETIILKALSKDKGRRYVTAGALGQDVLRYLSGDAIEAKRDSVLYVLSKTVRRYWIPAAVAASFVLTSVVGFGFSTAMWHKAEQNLDRAEKAETAQTDALQRKREVAHVATSQLVLNSWQRGDTNRTLNLLDGQLPEDGPDLRGFEWHYVSRQCATELVSLGRPSDVGCNANAVISPNARFVVASRHDGTATVWDLSSEDEVAVIGQAIVDDKAEATDLVTGAAFNTDGSRLALASGFGGLVSIWETEDWQLVSQWKTHGRAVGKVQWAGGKLITLGGERAHGQEIRFWDVQTQDNLHTIPTEDRIQDVVVSHDGERLATLETTHGIKVWDLSTFEVIWSKNELPLKRHFRSALADSNRLAFSPDDQRLASVGADGLARVWDVKSGEPQLLLMDASPCTCVSFSTDGTRLAIGGTDTMINVWNVADGNRLMSLRGHRNVPSSVVFSPDGWRLASLGSRGTLKVWDAHSDPSVQTLHQSKTGRPATNHHKQPKGHLTCMAVNGDGSRLVSGNLGGKVVLWNTFAGLPLQTFRHTSQVLSVAISDDGSRIATGDLRGGVRVWHAKDGSEVWASDELKRPVLTLSFALGDERVYAGTIPGEDSPTVYSFSSTSGEVVHSAGNSGVQRIAPLTGNRMAAFNRLRKGDGSSLTFWGSELSFQEEFRSENAERWSCYAISSDGLRIASAVDRGSVFVKVSLYDVQSGERRLFLSAHDRPIKAMSFSPDGRRLITAGEDGMVRVVDTSDFQELLHIRSQSQENICGLQFSGDGQVLAMATRADGLVQVWDGRLPASEDSTWRAAVSLVRYLFSQDGSKESVVKRLSEDASLSGDLRNRAVDLARQD